MQKIKDLRQICNERGLDPWIEVDGGINIETSKLSIKAGANVLVAGGAIFSEASSNYSHLVKSLRNEH